MTIVELRDTFWIMELIPYHSHLVLLLFVGVTHFKKTPKAPLVQIGLG